MILTKVFFLKEKYPSDQRRLKKNPNKIKTEGHRTLPPMSPPEERKYKVSGTYRNLSL
jgi:hypothetical protein